MSSGSPAGLVNGSTVPVRNSSTSSSLTTRRSNSTSTFIGTSDIKASSGMTGVVDMVLHKKQRANNTLHYSLFMTMPFEASTGHRQQSDLVFGLSPTLDNCLG